MMHTFKTRRLTIRSAAWIATPLAVAIAASIALPLLAQQSKPATTPTPATNAIHVGGVGLQSISLTPADFDKMPHQTVKAMDHDSSISFEGVLVGDLLKKAGFTFGQHLRGPRLADYLAVSSRDGFRVVFALPELDAEFSDRVVLIADRENGKPLSDRDGPYRLIVSDEKKHARWVRNVASLAVATSTPDRPKP